eukprot:GHVS01001641.1.p1 GENE.GHVS01001641.1~~GHVS01001641.1.p1  ORF type:complete len:376 (+),score=89.33 GHVS01001641.1:217-1344(+)
MESSSGCGDVCRQVGDCLRCCCGVGVVGMLKLTLPNYFLWSGVIYLIAAIYTQITFVPSLFKLDCPAELIANNICPIFCNDINLILNSINNTTQLYPTHTTTTPTTATTTTSFIEQQQPIASSFAPTISSSRRLLTNSSSKYLSIVSSATTDIPSTTNLKCRRSTCRVPQLVFVIWCSAFVLQSALSFLIATGFWVFQRRQAPPSSVIRHAATTTSNSTSSSFSPTIICAATDTYSSTAATTLTTNNNNNNNNSQQAISVERAAQLSWSLTKTEWLLGFALKLFCPFLKLITLFVGGLFISAWLTLGAPQLGGECAKTSTLFFPSVLLSLVYLSQVSVAVAVRGYSKPPPWLYSPPPQGEGCCKQTQKCLHVLGP